MSRFQDNIIENFKTIIIPLNFGNNTTQVSYTIPNIEFESQEVILNAISFVDESGTVADTGPLLLLTCNLPLNTNQLCCIPGNGTTGFVKLDSYFKLSTNNIGGIYYFILSNATTGGLPSTAMGTFNYNLSLTLTFNRYKNLN